jgi:hypothetical protein
MIIIKNLEPIAVLEMLLWHGDQYAQVMIKED